MNEYMKKRQQQILNGRPLEHKEKKPIAKVSVKRAEKIAKEKEERGDGDTELQKFFKSVMKRMGNYCYECGCKVENHVYQYAIMSICHILAKRPNMCPSVKSHPANWITLCPDHHHMFDNASWEQRELMGCWETVRDRLVMVYPNLAIEERRHFPESVLAYMKKHDVFPE